MKSLVLAQKLTPAVNLACAKDARLRKSYGKIEGILEGYAAGKKIRCEELRVLHVSDERGEIQPDLIRFIEASPRLPGQSEKRYRRYISEKESGLRRLIRALTGIKLNNAKGEKKSAPVLLESIPDYIKPLLEKLPHARRDIADNSIIRKPNDVLTEYAQLLLLAVCRVDGSRYKDQEHPALADLLVNHFNDIREELRSLIPSPRRFWRACNTFRHLLRNMDRPVKTIKAGASVDINDWPEPLKSQHTQYVQLAMGKASPSTSLMKSAVKHGFSIKCHRKRTISLVTGSIAQALAHITYDSTLSIADLICLQPTNVVTEEGSAVEDRNPNIDQVRLVEQEKITRLKRANYDSEFTKDFFFAVKAIAARTGYGHLVEAFNRAYRLRLDKESRQAWKKDKKKGIKRTWIDSEIERLGAEFDIIIRRRLFERVPGRRNRDADRAMRLCLFYVQFLMMRFVGYRQQAIRGCVLGRNITFLRNGTVILHFDEEEVKNGRKLHFEIKPTEGGTHERLRRTLISYNRTVLPYIQSRDVSSLGGHFFVQFAGNTGGFRQFNNANQYTIFFSNRVAEFINLQDLEPHVRNHFNAHFLRGVCADWMIYDLQMSYEEAARVLGDTVDVLKRDYADRNEVCDATPVFDKVNTAHGATPKSESAAASGSRGSRAEKTLNEQLTRKEQQVETLTTTLELVQRQLGDEIASLKAALAQATAANAVTV